jgi:hypothetical protein
MHETIINTKKIHLFSPFCQYTRIFGGKTKIKNNHNCVRMHYSRKNKLSSNKISPIKKKVTHSPLYGCITKVSPMRK